MTPPSSPQGSTTSTQQAAFRQIHWVMIGASALIFIILILQKPQEPAFAYYVLLSLALLNIGLLSYAKMVSNKKSANTYTETNTTIVPPANPTDVLAGIPDLLWTIDYASRRVSSHNQAHIEHHPDACHFAKLANILPARVSRQYLESLIELQNTQKPIRFEYTLGNEHEQFTFEARLSPLSQRDCVVVIRDISHIKATEEALFKQQIFTQQIIDSSPNLVFIRDQYGRFLLVNQATQALIGHELLVQSHLELDDNNGLLRTGDKEVFATGKKLRVEDHFILPNGRSHWFDITKVAVEREGKTYILNIAIDITAQKEQQTTQAESKTLLHAMAHALPHAFLLVQQEQIVFANHAACQRLAYSPDQLIGEPCTLVFADQQGQPHIQSALGELVACQLQKLESEQGTLITLH